MAPMSNNSGIPAGAGGERAGVAELGTALKKISWRLIPFLFLLYVVAYLDRVNVGFAQLQMKKALEFSDAVYGFGAGLFFVSYFIFELPSNLLLERFGPRRVGTVALHRRLGSRGGDDCRHRPDLWRRLSALRRPTLGSRLQR